MSTASDVVDALSRRNGRREPVERDEVREYRDLSMDSTGRLLERKKPQPGSAEPQERVVGQAPTRLID